MGWASHVCVFSLFRHLLYNQPYLRNEHVCVQSKSGIFYVLISFYLSPFEISLENLSLYILCSLENHEQALRCLCYPFLCSPYEQLLVQSSSRSTACAVALSMAFKYHHPYIFQPFKYLALCVKIHSPSLDGFCSSLIRKQVRQHDMLFSHYVSQNTNHWSVLGLPPS